MTLAAVHASLSHLIASQDRNKAAISDIIDGIVPAHQHGGKDAFDERVADLCAAVDTTFFTMGAIHDTARTASGLQNKMAPHLSSWRESHSAEYPAAACGRARAAHIGVPEGE